MKKGCAKVFLKEEGIIIEGRWYCSEKCAPTTEELLMEEQRMLKQFEKEDGSYKKEIEEEKGNEQFYQSKGGESDDEREEDAFDLGVSMSNKKEVLTLAELEEKYKNLNKITENAKSKEHDLEDSLN